MSTELLNAQFTTPKAFLPTASTLCRDCRDQFASQTTSEIKLNVTRILYKNMTMDPTTRACPCIWARMARTKDEEDKIQRHVLKGRLSQRTPIAWLRDPGIVLLTWIYYLACWKMAQFSRHNGVQLLNFRGTASLVVRVLALEFIFQRETHQPEVLAIYNSLKAFLVHLCGGPRSFLRWMTVPGSPVEMRLDASVGRGPQCPLFERYVEKQRPFLKFQELVCIGICLFEHITGAEVMVRSFRRSTLKIVTDLWDRGVQFPHESDLDGEHELPMDEMFIGFTALWKTMTYLSALARVEATLRGKTLPALPANSIRSTSVQCLSAIIHVLIRPPSGTFPTGVELDSEKLKRHLRENVGIEAFHQLETTSENYLSISGCFTITDPALADQVSRFRITPAGEQLYNVDLLVRRQEEKKHTQPQRPTTAPRPTTPPRSTTTRSTPRRSNKKKRKSKRKGK